MEQANPSAAQARGDICGRALESSRSPSRRFLHDGALGEVFINSRKTGGDVEAIARDAAVLLSLALQHGVASRRSDTP